MLYGGFMRKYIGFTLAEVLITLGIIGIVASLTIPMLIQDYRNNVAETRLKKFYSTMNQAIALSINDNGDVETWNYFNDGGIDKDGNVVNNKTDANDKSFKTYLAPYLKIESKKEIVDNTGQKRILYFFEDGSAFTFASHENRDIDFFPKNPENCIKQKNRRGVCSFNFEFYPLENTYWWKHMYNKGMEAYMFNWNGNKNRLYNDTDKGCRNGNGIYCTAIIYLNNWKIPKDYPKRVAF